jgi:hypothetical protein
VQLGSRHCFVQITVLPELRSAALATHHMRLHVTCMSGIELVVEKSV